MFEENKGGQCGWTKLIEERVAQDKVLRGSQGPDHIQPSKSL